MKLDEVVDPVEVEKMIGARYVKAVNHPSCELTILNYTHAAQWDRVWNDTTRACRGLIYDRASREVVARPWPKFFNYGEHDSDGVLGLLDLDARVEVTDKLDGSLGIAYPINGTYMVATRGSFVSDQAMTATGLLVMEREFRPDPDLTYLFEIIYPANRIVVNYGERTGLVLLGAVQTATGATLSPSEVPGWRGDRVDVLEAETLAQALELDARVNAEGVVVRYPDTGVLVKIKQDDYVALHRIVTGMNERTVWQLMREGRTVDEICEPLPEEFWPWVRDVAAELVMNAALIAANAASAHEAVLDSLPDGWTRKDYAIRAQETAGPLLPYCFLLLDGKDLAPEVWKKIRPADPRTLVSVSEDVA